MAGEWEMLGVVRSDMKAPDWFHDPDTGRRSDPGGVRVPRKPPGRGAVGNIKQVWEVNRLQHLTLLATAWYLTRDDAYAERVDAQLRSWWAANPFLSGVNWTSGIELGVRLINFAWIRRLLDEWPGVADLFERNDLALHQIRWHQQYLAAFESRGSSANNHLIAEAAGQLAAILRVPLVRRKRPVAAPVRRAAGEVAARQHVPVGDQPRARVGLPRLRLRAGRLRRGRGGGRRVPGQRRLLAAARRDGRRHGRAGGRAAAAAAPG